MRPVSALGTFASLAAILAPAGVRADEVSGLRSDQVFERRQRAEVTMDRGHATVVIRRTVENRGSRHDQVTFDIGVPDAAVAVALRTLLITDLRTRMALRPVDQRLRSGAIVHVGVVGRGEPRLDPNDDSPWSDVIERSG